MSGVSWYEAAAYAAFAGKSLPVLGQWYQAANFDIAEYTVQMSNLRSARPAAVGKDRGLGLYGTYDMAGNVREWIANPVDGDYASSSLADPGNRQTTYIQVQKRCSLLTVPRPMDFVAFAIWVQCRWQRRKRFTESLVTSQNLSL